MLDRGTGIKWTNLIERDFIGTKVVAFLRNQPTFLPSAQLSLFRKPLPSNNHTQDPTLLLGTIQMDKNHSLPYGRQMKNQEGGPGNIPWSSFQCYLWRMLDIRGTFLREFASLC